MAWRTGEIWATGRPGEGDGPGRVCETEVKVTCEHSLRQMQRVCSG